MRQYSHKAHPCSCTYVLPGTTLSETHSGSRANAYSHELPSQSRSTLQMSMHRKALDEHCKTIRDEADLCEGDA